MGRTRSLPLEVPRSSAPEGIQASAVSWRPSPRTDKSTSDCICTCARARGTHGGLHACMRGVRTWGVHMDRARSRDGGKGGQAMARVGPCTEGAHTGGVQMEGHVQEVCVGGHGSRACKKGVHRQG